MGRPKLSIELWKGEKLGGLAMKQAYLSNLNAIVVVTRPVDTLGWLSQVYFARDQLKRCLKVVCEEADQGMAYSLRCGLDSAQLLGADGVVVMLADQPLISVEMINRLIDEFAGNPQLDYVASGDGLRKKPPVLWSKSMFGKLKLLEGDEGARSILDSSEYEGIIVGEPLSYRFLDVDTLEDVERILTMNIQEERD
jgi:molybdenum cofactor cytidylyltransferase